MRCEQARWLEFETEESQAHAATCQECREWLDDGLALRSLQQEFVPARPFVRQPARRWPAVAIACVAAAAILILLAPAPQIDPPSMPAVAITKPVLPPLPVPARQPARALARHEPSGKPKAAPPLYLKIETSDPDVVIYWTIEGGEE
jgi:hypothetical protein